MSNYKRPNVTTTINDPTTGRLIVVKSACGERVPSSSSDRRSGVSIVDLHRGYSSRVEDNDVGNRFASTRDMGPTGVQSGEVFGRCSCREKQRSLQCACHGVGQQQFRAIKEPQQYRPTVCPCAKGPSVKSDCPCVRQRSVGRCDCPCAKGGSSGKQEVESDEVQRIMVEHHIHNGCGMGNIIQLSPVNNGAACQQTTTYPVVTTTLSPSPPMVPMQPMHPMQPMQPSPPMVPMQPMHPMQPMQPIIHQPGMMAQPPLMGASPHGPSSPVMIQLAPAPLLVAPLMQNGGLSSPPMMIPVVRKKQARR